MSSPKLHLNSVQTQKLLLFKGENSGTLKFRPRRFLGFGGDPPNNTFSPISGYFKGKEIKAFQITD
jgi:hypothetical protein